VAQLHRFGLYKQFIFEKCFCFVRSSFETIKKGGGKLVNHMSVNVWRPFFSYVT